MTISPSADNAVERKRKRSEQSDTRRMVELLRFIPGIAFAEWQRGGQGKRVYERYRAVISYHLPEEGEECALIEKHGHLKYALIHRLRKGFESCLPHSWRHRLSLFKRQSKCAIRIRAFLSEVWSV
jgi:hypothetical protein